MKNPAYDRVRKVFENEKKITFNKVAKMVGMKALAKDLDIKPKQLRERVKDPRRMEMSLVIRMAESLGIEWSALALKAFKSD